MKLKRGKLQSNSSEVELMITGSGTDNGIQYRTESREITVTRDTHEVSIPIDNNLTLRDISKALQNIDQDALLAGADIKDNTLTLILVERI